MCIFSGKVEHVGNTKIFARKEYDPRLAGRQYIVYEMSVNAVKDVAMILPLPVSSHEEDDISFINLEGYPTFFKNMAKCFEDPHSKGMSRGIGKLLGGPLKVHDVGYFIASFVPDKDSFSRVDKVFRLPDEAWNSLPDYSDYGFAVFQLKANKQDQNIHPMAFSFPSKLKELFFPTVHVHDGKVHAREEYDHKLYWQGEKKDRYGMKSYTKTSSFVDCGKTQGIVLDDFAYRASIEGLRKNEDILISV